MKAEKELEAKRLELMKVDDMKEIRKTTPLSPITKPSILKK